MSLEKSMKLETRAECEAWLRTEPRVVSVALATRGALRVLPLLAIHPDAQRLGMLARLARAVLDRGAERRRHAELLLQTFFASATAAAAVVGAMSAAEVAHVLEYTDADAAVFAPSAYDAVYAARTTAFGA